MAATACRRSTSIASTAAADWTLVTTDRVTPGAAPHGAHVIRIDERAFRSTGFRYEDLVAAVDVVVTKPGYGIIAECIAAGTAMLYTSRGHFREYDVLVAGAAALRAQPVHQPQDDLFAGRWRDALEALLAQPAPPETMATDGAAHAAAEIRRDVGLKPASYPHVLRARVQVRMNAGGTLRETRCFCGGPPMRRVISARKIAAGRAQRVGVDVLEGRERAARPQDVLDAVEDVLRHLGRQARERQTRDDVIDGLQAAIGDQFLELLGRGADELDVRPVAGGSS